MKVCLLFKLFSPQKILRENQQPHSAISQLTVYPKVGPKVWFGTSALMPADCLSLPPPSTPNSHFIFLIAPQLPHGSQGPHEAKTIAMNISSLFKDFPSFKELLSVTTASYYLLEFGRNQRVSITGFKMYRYPEELPNLHTSLKAKYLRL